MMVIDGTTRDDGVEVAIVTFVIPRATFVVEWTQEEAQAFAQKLYEQFGHAKAEKKIVPATLADMPKNGKGLRSV